MAALGQTGVHFSQADAGDVSGDCLRGGRAWPSDVCSIAPCCKAINSSACSPASLPSSLKSSGGSSMASSVRAQVPQWIPKLCLDFTSCSAAHAGSLAEELLPRPRSSLQGTHLVDLDSVCGVTVLQVHEPCRMTPDASRIKWHKALGRSHHCSGAGAALPHM